MPNETREIVEQVLAQAPKEFKRVKMMRNYASLAVLAVFVLSGILDNSLEGTDSQCVLIPVTLFILIGLVIWLREIWKCPVCYKNLGWLYRDPKFCNECGTKLAE
jgi:hypothetical protein